MVLGFDAERRQEREWLSYLRAGYKMLPGRQAMLRHAAAIIVGSRHTGSEIPRRYRDKSVYIPENAVDPARFNARAAPPGDVLRACFIGRMVPYKGPDMLLKAALPLLQAGKLHLDMIGDGPILPELKFFATAHEIGDAITFHGWLDHAEVQDVATRSQLLAFPSVREFGGGVVLEAMALGLVPLTVDYAGPGELVTPDAGFKVAIGPRNEIVNRFRAKLTELAEDPSALPEMASNARRRVEKYFTWDGKVDQVLAIYDWLLGQRPDRPDPFDHYDSPEKDTG